MCFQEDVGAPNWLLFFSVKQEVWSTAESGQEEKVRVEESAGNVKVMWKN